LRSSTVATTEETLALIEQERLYDTGCGAVDISLLASALLTLDAGLWTFDKNLESLANQLNAAFTESAG
jgi:hypothetical protein